MSERFVRTGRGEDNGRGILRMPCYSGEFARSAVRTRGDDLVLQVPVFGVSQLSRLSTLGNRASAAPVVVIDRP